MPIHDARSSDFKTGTKVFDVCIIGAGAAGLFLATVLARRGLEVIMAEAGGRTCCPEGGLGIETPITGDSYRGTTEGRAFGLGGSTSLWGGQLIPHTRLDNRSENAEGFDFWKHLVSVVEQHSRQVGETLELRPRPDWHLAKQLIPETIDILRSKGLETLTSDWLPFRKRNLAYLLKSLPAHFGKNLHLLLNASAVSWELTNPTANGTHVKALSLKSGDRLLTIRARAFVAAAGAIETPRLLLELDSQVSGGVIRPGAAVGRYLADHLSCRIADVVPKDYDRCAHLFGPRFQSGRMRTFRFVEKHAPASTPRCFFHFIYDNENAGFLVAKKALLGLQSRTLPDIAAGEMLRGLSGLTGLAWNRFLRQRLFIPGGTSVHLQIDIEQTPQHSNAITLLQERDAAGRSKAALHWSVHADDYRAISDAARRMSALWPGHQNRLPELEMAIDDAASPKPHDVYHPVGTCRMGDDTEAVVGPDLRVHGLDNLFVLSTAVFPTAGTANPTFSMFCLGNALAENLVSKFSSLPVSSD